MVSYVVNWTGWDAKDNTIEPEEHLLTCTALITYWKGRKDKKQLERVTKLQAAALRELVDVAANTYRTRTGKGFHKDVTGAGDVPKAMWAVPKCLLILREEADGVICSYANPAAAEALAVRLSQFGGFWQPLGQPAAQSNYHTAKHLIANGRSDCFWLAIFQTMQ